MKFGFNLNRTSRLILLLALSSLELTAQSQTVSDKSQLAKHTLYNSDGSVFKRLANYPKFSWEVTPQYFMFGDMNRVLKPEEVKFIAKQSDFICIEKAHGFKPLGAAELGAKHEAAAFKKVKPDIKVLFYFNSVYAYSFTSYTKGLSKAQIDKHPELKKFLLIDPETGKLAHRSNVYHFDVLNPDFREWWVSTVVNGVEDSACDGAFIDQMHGFSWMRPEKTPEVRKAMGEMMGSLKKKLGPDKILLGNNAHQKPGQEVFPVVDVIMFEHYKGKLLSKETLLNDWRDMLKIAKAGKMSIFRIGVEADLDHDEEKNAHLKRGARDAMFAQLAKEKLEYYLAVYLIGAYSRVKKNGWEFTREFEHASVWVDTEKRQAKITWK